MHTTSQEHCTLCRAASWLLAFLCAVTSLYCGSVRLHAQDIPDAPLPASAPLAATTESARPPSEVPPPATASGAPDKPIGPEAPQAEWFKKESFDGHFIVESQDTSANLLIMEAAQQFHELAVPFLDLPRPYRNRVYIQARKIRDVSEFKPAAIAAGLSRGQLQFRIGIWYPSPQAKEELLRALTTIFLYEKLLAGRETWRQGDMLPPLPLWLTEGTLQHLINPVTNRDFYQIVYRGYSSDTAPKLETIAAWKGLSNDPVFRRWQQTYSYYLVDLAVKNEANVTLQDWLTQGANLSTPTKATPPPTPATESPDKTAQGATTETAATPPLPVNGAPFPGMLTQAQWERKLVKAEQWSRDLIYSFNQTEAELQLVENIELEELTPEEDASINGKSAKDKEKDKANEKAKAKSKGIGDKSSAPNYIPLTKSGEAFPVPMGMHPVINKQQRRTTKNTISVRIDALASRRNHPGLAKALNAKVAELMRLELRAHFAWRPVLTIYRQALTNLPDAKAKPSYESLIMSAGNARKQLIKFNEKVTDYMNWYVVANPIGAATDVSNSTFSEYFEMRRQLEQEDKDTADPYRKTMLKVLGPDALR